MGSLRGLARPRSLVSIVREGYNGETTRVQAEADRQGRVFRVKVVINDRPLWGKRTGIGQYLASVLSNWPASDYPDIELVGLHQRELLKNINVATFSFPAPETIEPVSLRPLHQLTRPKPSWKSYLKAPMQKLGMEGIVHATVMAARWQATKGDLYFEPNTIAVVPRQPLVATMFDLSVIEVPECHPADRVRQWNANLEKTIRKVDHWFCISETTAEIFDKLYGVGPDRTTIVPMASRWQDPPADWEPALLRQQLKLPPRYVAYLGTIEPRKNLIRLLDAYALADAAWRKEYPLILVGNAGWGSDQYWNEISQHPMAGEVMFTGYVSDEQAAAILRGATVFAYPSIYEGFAIPPLEAMALGTPVVASSASCIPATCGNAALLADPHDSHAWLEGMQRLATDGDQRRQLIAAGYVRAKDFDWASTARAHAELFARQLGASHSPRSNHRAA